MRARRLGLAGLVFGLAALVSSCSMSKGDGSSPEKVPTTCWSDPQSRYAGFTYTVTPADFSTSSLYYCDFAGGKIARLLAGESGDPLPVWLLDKLYFFNRTLANANFRALDPRAESAVVTPQIATPSAGWGDPKAVVELDDGRIMMAMVGSHSLLVVDPSAGQKTAAIEVSRLELGPAGASQDDYGFYPVALLHRTDAKAERVYVLHAHYKSTGYQQVFVLEKQADGAWQFSDLDAKAGIQGIKLHYTNPARFLFSDATAPLLVSLCSELSKDSCKAGVERLDLEGQKSTALGSLDEPGRLGADAVEAGSEGVVYAKLYDAKGTDRYIAKVSIQNGLKVERFHTLAPGSGVAAALFSDPTSGTLYAGDGTSAESMSITAVGRDGAKLAEFYPGGIPYNVAFVPKAK